MMKLGLCWNGVCKMSAKGWVRFIGGKLEGKGDREFDRFLTTR